MPIPDEPTYTHGSTGTQPASGTDFQNGDPLPAEQLDWLFNTPVEKTKAIIAYLNDVDSDGDGKVDAAETADTAADTTTVKGNDIDSDGDGKVNSAEVADSAKTYKGTDIDSNGDGKVDAADTADSAATYKGTDIDTNGDGKVDAADTADQAANATTVKGNDIDSDGDGKVDAADTADQADNATTVKGNDIDADGDGKVDAAEDADVAAGLTGVAHSELTDAPADAHHSEQHGANQHNTDDLHNTAVTIPSYATKSDVPSLAEGQMVYIENDNAFYFEDGT